MPDLNWNVSSSTSTVQIKNKMSTIMTNNIIIISKIALHNQYNKKYLRWIVSWELNLTVLLCTKLFPAHSH